MVVTGGVAGAQTNNPYPGSIGAGLLVGVRDFATVPDSAGAKARLNSAAVSPDGRFFVIDQRGPVHSISSLGAVTTYLDLSAAGWGLLNDNGERGVGQIAFHPQFNQVGEPGYGKLYASFSTNDLAPTPDFSVGGRVHDEVIYEFTTNDPSAATFTPAPGSSPRQVLRIAQPATNHNGGGLAFNPNAAAGTPDYGALYYSSGDGGGAGDPYAQGQSAGTPLAAILRIDPLGTNGVGGDHGIVADNLFASDGNGGTLAENYAIGLRNPQRFSWDRGGAKRMFIGDIGQGMVEEVDLGLNGANYGWPVREGSFTYVDTGHVSSSPAPDDPAYTRPLAEYDHGEGSAISGGFVYRGGAIAGLDGQYVFGDLVNGRIFLHRRGPDLRRRAGCAVGNAPDRGWGADGKVAAAAHQRDAGGGQFAGGCAVRAGCGGEHVSAQQA